MSLLEVRGLSVGLKADGPLILRDVTLGIEAREVLGLVGESGSGKTLLSLAVTGLLGEGIELRAASVRLEGKELVTGTRDVRRTARDITLIFQDPRAALNPTMRVGDQIARVFRINQRLSRHEARRRAVAMLGHVRIPGPERVARAYAHQLSGGMCQRVLIAMALACRPKILIADEPTSALDVTVQAQIFALIKELIAETACGALFITHDLGAVAEICDRVVVLYGGQVMEISPVLELFERPRHPYTRYLLDSALGDPDPRAAERGADFSLPGCRFAHLCPHAFGRCATVPPAFDIGPGHASACWLHAEDSR